MKTSHTAVVAVLSKHAIAGPHCSCDSDRLRRGLHGIITFGIPGPLPPEQHSTQTVPLCPCAVWNPQVKGTSPSLTCIGWGWAGRWLGQASEKGDMPPPSSRIMYLCMVLACTACTDSQPCSWFVCLTSGALVNSIQARMTQLAAREPDDTPELDRWMKLPEPSAERGQLSLQQGVPGPRAAAHASPLYTSFFPFFPSSPPFAPFSPSRGRMLCHGPGGSFQREGHLNTLLAHLPPPQSPHHRESIAVPSTRARGT